MRDMYMTAVIHVAPIKRNRHGTWHASSRKRAVRQAREILLATRPWAATWTVEQIADVPAPGNPDPASLCAVTFSPRFTIGL